MEEGGDYEGDEGDEGNKGDERTENKVRHFHRYYALLSNGLAYVMEHVRAVCVSPVVLVGRSTGKLAFLPKALTVAGTSCPSLMTSAIVFVGGGGKPDANDVGRPFRGFYP